jgi:hypothetical protein
MTRDVVAWQATMTRLDAEEQVAKEPFETRRLTPPEIVDYTRSLPRLWADSGPDGRQALVVAIFARLDVPGFQRFRIRAHAGCDRPWPRRSTTRGARVAKQDR